MKHTFKLALLALTLGLAACGTQEAGPRDPMQNPAVREVMMTAAEAPDEEVAFTEELSAQSGNSGNSRVRVVHFSPDAPAVDILVDDQRAILGLEYPKFVGPVSLPAGQRNLKVNVVNTSTTVINATLPFEADLRYSLFALNKVANIEALRLLDTRFAARGAAKVRLLHAAPSAPAVDIYVSRPGVPLERLEPVVQSLTFKNSTPYLRIRPGKLQVRITLAGTRTVAIDTGELEVAAGNIFTAAAIEKKGEAGFTATLINERQTITPTPPQLPSIVQIATSNPNFSTLVGALQAADLVGALQGDGPFTVFAPTNDAFAKLSSVPAGDALRNVLLYHVAQGKLSATQLLQAGEVTTLQGQKVRVRAGPSNSLILNDNVMVIIKDIQAANGIIHVVDTVLLPLPSIVEIATGNSNFSTLVSALQSANLVSALQGAGPFTVFAPTNAAFAKLSALPSGDALREVLLYHVASGRFTAAQLLQAGEVTTLQGRKIRVERRGSDVILNGVVRVTTADIPASNGIVHIIDTVLIPPLPSIVEIASSNPDFSTLVSALQSANLVSALSGAGPFTVFAPTNAAFARLSSLPTGNALRNVLLYHVVSGRITSAMLRDHSAIHSLLGPSIQVSIRNGQIFLNNTVRITTADIPASNGVIHIIDAVLIPPTH
ncbi:fasciclin domain-containing protein [Meiothermus sp.]|uniref:fasciclin domain-containing protein n=1 Tax=Meiothermus sp. TaxID=1955249 RepID=UPI00307D270E